MMDPLDYLHLQMRLEGKGIFNECLMRQVEIVPGEDLPLILLAKFEDRSLVAYYHESMSPELRQELAHGICRIEYPDIEYLLNILRRYSIGFEIGHYRTHIFPSMPSSTSEVRCLSKNDPRVKEFGFDGFAEQVYALECEGKLVSACVSTREDKRCGEAWVYTAPEYRHHGFAQKVVDAWAGSLMEAGKIPFYSHHLENNASANLAGKLRLQPVFEEISISPREDE